MFADLEPTAAHIEWMQSCRQRAHVVVELSETLGPKFGDHSDALATLAGSSLWLSRHGIEPLPLPSNDAVDVVAEILDMLLEDEDVTVDAEGVA